MDDMLCICHRINPKLFSHANKSDLQFPSRGPCRGALFKIMIFKFFPIFLFCEDTGDKFTDGVVNIGLQGGERLLYPTCKC